MPNKDRTGPEGKGSKTGQQMGYCEGAEPLAGPRMGRRPCDRGCGRGRRFD